MGHSGGMIGTLAVLTFSGGQVQGVQGSVTHTAQTPAAPPATCLHLQPSPAQQGHRLKNMNCKLIRELRTLHTENKLLLTGTPLQVGLSCAKILLVECMLRNNKLLLAGTPLQVKMSVAVLPVELMQ